MCEQANLTCLLDAVKKGQRTDTGWKPEVIANAQLTFAAKGLKAFNNGRYAEPPDIAILGNDRLNFKG